MECQAWLLPSLLRAGRRDEAKKLLAGISTDALAGHPGNYQDRLLLFKGTKTEAQVAATMAAEGPISEATVGYRSGCGTCSTAARPRRASTSSGPSRRTTRRPGATGRRRRS